MARVEAFGLEGLDLWFNSRDHPPPHFHVRRVGEWEIRAYILETSTGSLRYSRKWGREPDGRSIRTLCDLVVAHRANLLTEWNRKVNR